MTETPEFTMGFTRISTIGFTFDIRDTKNSFKSRSTFTPSKIERDLLDLKVFRFNSESEKLIFKELYLDSLEAGKFPRFESDLISFGREADLVSASESMRRYLGKLLHGKLSKSQQKAAIGHLTCAMENANRDRFYNIPDEITDSWVGREVLAIARKLRQHPEITDDPIEIDNDQFSLVSFFSYNSFFQKVLSESKIAGDFTYIKSAFHLLVARKEKVLQDLAIRTAWLLSYFDDNIVGFIALAEEFDWHIDEKTFPWLNHDLIGYYRESIRAEYKPGLTMLDNMKLAMPALASIDSRLQSARTDHTSQFEMLRIIHNLSDIANNDRLVVAQLRSEIDSEAITELCTWACEEYKTSFPEDIYAALSSVLYVTKDFIIDLQDEIENEVGIDFYQYHRDDICSLFETHLEQPIADVAIAVEEYLHLCQTIKETEDEAHQLLELGKELLESDNLHKLARLKEDLAQFNASINVKIDAIKDELKRLSEGRGEFQKPFTKLLSSWEPVDENATGKLKESLEKTRIALNNTQQQVSMLEQDNNNLAFKLEDTKDKLAKAQRRELEPADSGASSSVKNEITNDFLMLALNGSISLTDVMDFLLSRHQESVSLSKSVMKSLANNREFSKLGTLFEKLDTLMSAEFLTEYSKNGSQFAFEHFTTKELSFNESDQTLSEHGDTREFMFDDGKRLCEKHLRIGNNGKRQHMLRVYFTIEGGHLYIGDIVPHLPTSTKR